MVLSELIANADLVDTAAHIDAAAADQSAQRLSGQKLVNGMGAGIAVFHQPRITIEHTVAEDTEAERHRVYAAFDTKIGRASCRERVGQYVLIAVVAVSLNKKQKNRSTSLSIHGKKTY